MPTANLLPALLCLAALLSPLARASSDFPTQSFSCAISTYTLKAGDAPYEVCSINASSISSASLFNYLSMQWFTGTFDKPYGSESVLISM